ncbi:acyl-CoA synthetase, partial [Nocardia sp. NPDC003345]
MTEWSIPAVFDAVAEAAGDRVMTICGDRRTTFAESALLTRRFGSFLASRGLGAQTPRAGLDRWECGQDRVAL